MQTFIGLRQIAILRSTQAWFCWLIAAGAISLTVNRTEAQDRPVQPAGYPLTEQINPGPTWQDFNELTARLQATEARLQALSGAPSSDATPYDVTYEQQPGSQSSLSAVTQTPENIPEILARLTNVEQTLQTQQNRLPLVRMTGFAQLDQGFFSQDAQSRANIGDVQDGVGFRRARLQAVGNISEFTRYSFEMDFAVAGRPSFLDVWAEQTNVPFFGNVRIGHFRQPTTMDSWTSIRHLEFLERSLPFQAMDPFRRVGIMSWFNAGEDDRTLIAYSVYGTGFTFDNSAQGGAPTYGSIGDSRFATQIGDNGGVSAAIRGSHLLYYDPLADNRYLLHIGGGYNFSEIGGVPGRGANARTYEARAIPEFFVGDPAGATPASSASGTPFVADTGRFLANDFHFFHTELGGNYGSAHFQTEWMGTLVDQLNGPAVFYQGAYVQCGYFLTGESCGYNKQMGALDYNVKPFREFFGLGRDQWFCGWGAWEVAAQYSYINLASNAITTGPTGSQLSPGLGGAGPPFSPNPGTVNDMTLALNWWWNQYTRVQFNYIYCNQNPSTQNVNGAATGIMGIYAARFQFEF